MKKRNYLLVIFVGVIWALGVFAVQSRTEDLVIITNEVTPPTSTAAPGVSIRFIEEESGCDASGIAHFILRIDEDVAEGGIAFGPWVVLLIDGGKPPKDCFSQPYQMSGTFVVSTDDPYYYITYDWSGWSDIITNLDSGYALVCAQLDDAFNEFRKKNPITRDTVLLEEDSDCIPNQVLASP
ncbi:MAG: hypothetical protein JSW17_05165 [Candidatus Omnitrophota bacterium]|nr:MAG: hypothetical protein JSW17_05165 [Candidatus Omnitrophota bacterium]